MIDREKVIKFIEEFRANYKIFIDKSRVNYRKVKKYIYNDYGIDLNYDKFKKTKFAKVLFTIIIAISSICLEILFTGALCALSLVYPWFFLLWACIALIGLLYIEMRDKIDDKYRIL